MVASATASTIILLAAGMLACGSGARAGDLAFMPDGIACGDPLHACDVAPGSAPIERDAAVLIRVDPKIIKQGRTLDGIGLDGLLFDDRLSFTASELYGDDLLGAAVVTSPALAAHQNWRRELRFNAILLRSSWLDADLSGDLFEARLPAQIGVGPLGIGEVQGWSEASSRDLGLDLSLFGGGTRYSGRYSWSSVDGEEGFGLGSETKAGWAQQHRLEALLWDQDGVGLTVSGSYSYGDPSYRGLLGFTRSNQALDRGSRHHPLMLMPWYAPLPDSETATIGALLRVGPAELALDNLLVAQPSDPDLLRRSQRMQLRLDLTALLADEAEDASLLSGWMPSAVVLRGRRGRLVDDAAGEPGHERASLSLTELFDFGVGSDPGVRERETGIGFALEWEWTSADASVELWRVETAKRRSGDRTAISERWTLDISQSVYAEDWDLSLYASASQAAANEPSSRSRETSFGGGLSLSWFPEGVPPVTFWADLFDERYLAGDDDYESAARDISLGASIDFSGLVRETLQTPDASLAVKYRLLHNWADESAVGSESDFNHALTLTGGLRF